MNYAVYTDHLDMEDNWYLYDYFMYSFEASQLTKWSSFNIFYFKEITDGI